MYPPYMCILLYVTLIWCNRYFIDVLSIGVEDICILSICAFFYMWIVICSVKVFHRCIVNWSWRVYVSSVYVHFADMCNLFGVMCISEIYHVNWSGSGVDVSCSICAILLYVTLVCGVTWYSLDVLSIGVGVDVSSVYVHSADMCTFSWCIHVFHRCIVNWSLRGICILSICAFCYMC